jgi:hypothetical protein
MPFLFFSNLVIAVVVRKDDIGEFVCTIRGIPVPIDDDFPAGIGNVIIGRGKLLGVFIKAIEDRGDDEYVQEENDDQRRLAERLAIETCEFGCDLEKRVPNSSDYAHNLPLS